MQSACAMLYFHLWPVWIYHIFPHYVINCTICWEKSLNTKCVLIFSTAFACNISHSKKKCARYDRKSLNTKCVLVFSTTFVCNISHSKKKCARYDYKYRYMLVFTWRTHYSRYSLMKLKFSRQTFEKYSNSKFSWKSRPTGAELFHVDRQTDMTKLVVAFHILAKASKNKLTRRMKTRSYDICNNTGNSLKWILWNKKSEGF